jgi:hypothetical protein
MPEVPEQKAVNATELKQYLKREHLRRVHRPQADMSSDEGTHIRLHQVEYFLAAARHGNFGKAAEELQISGSALGQAIADLEHNLGDGVRLFERNQNGARITAEGEALLEHAERLLDVEDSARVAVAKAQGRTAPSRRGAVETVESPIVVDVEAIQRFRKESANSVLAAIEFIEERASGPVAFSAGTVDELKKRLTDLKPSGESVDAMAHVIDALEASVSGDALPEPAEHASDKFRDLHAAAAKQFTQRSVRFDAGEHDGARSPERMRSR